MDIETLTPIAPPLLERLPPGPPSQASEPALPHKRKRGRPRKHPLPVLQSLHAEAQGVDVVPETTGEPPTPQIMATTARPGPSPIVERETPLPETAPTAETITRWLAILGQRIGDPDLVPILLRIPRETLDRSDPESERIATEAICRVLRTTTASLSDPEAQEKVAQRAWPKEGLDPWLEDLSPAALRSLGMGNREIGALVGISISGVTRTIQRGGNLSARALRLFSPEERLQYTNLILNLERATGGHRQLCSYLGISSLHRWRSTVFSNNFTLSVAKMLGLHPSLLGKEEATRHLRGQFPTTLPWSRTRALTPTEKENLLSLLRRCQRLAGATALARKMGLSPRAIWTMWQGDGIGPSKIEKIASLLGVPHEEVLAGKVTDETLRAKIAPLAKAT
jgi:DNA-binding transcriptional regulator YdaS (Cro superfamily)